MDEKYRVDTREYNISRSVSLNKTTFGNNICEVIKRNESYVGNVDFEIRTITLLFSARQSYLSISSEP